MCQWGKEEQPMGDGPPARAPEAAGSRSGCAVTPRGDAGKPWETMGRRARGCRTATFAKRGPVLCSFGDAAETKGALANHWKQWDAKPEAVGRGSALSSFGCMANHGKPWGAKLWGLKGRLLRGNPPEFVPKERIQLCLWQPGYRTSLRPHNAKKGRRK